jgi:uncharacterized membrane protein
MIKKHLKFLIITSVVTVLPILMGVILWEQLPAQLPIHWDMEGEIDGWCSKAFAVFAMPLILLAFHWLAVFATFADPKNRTNTNKALRLGLWVVPVLSIALSVVIYSVSMGGKVRMEAFVPVLLGMLFVIIGNYLPKCQQSYTIGIKCPWTLHSEENWNRTHRLAGWLWVIGGVVIMLTGFCNALWVSMPVALIMVLVPVIYSYILHRKGI